MENYLYERFVIQKWYIIIFVKNVNILYTKIEEYSKMLSSIIFILFIKIFYFDKFTNYYFKIHFNTVFSI